MFPELILLISLYVLLRSLEINKRNRPAPGDPFYTNFAIRIVGTLAIIWSCLMVAGYSIQAFSAALNPTVQPSLYDWNTTPPKPQ